MNSLRKSSIFNSTLDSTTLQEIDVLNQNASVSQGVPRSQMLVMTLETVFAMALDIPLPKEYYQCSRLYLESVRNEDGSPLPNASGCLKFIDKFEEKHKIEDEMQQMKAQIPPEETIEIQIDEAPPTGFGHGNIFSSTRTDPQTPHGGNPHHLQPFAASTPFDQLQLTPKVKQGILKSPSRQSLVSEASAKTLDPRSKANDLAKTDSSHSLEPDSRLSLDVSTVKSGIYPGDALNVVENAAQQLEAEVSQVPPQKTSSIPRPISAGKSSNLQQNPGSSDLNSPQNKRDILDNKLKATLNHLSKIDPEDTQQILNASGFKARESIDPDDTLENTPEIELVDSPPSTPPAED